MHQRLILFYKYPCRDGIANYRHILVRLGRLCLWVNCTAMLVSINQPLQTCVDLGNIRTNNLLDCEHIF
jgi:hypothetical protein